MVPQNSVILFLWCDSTWCAYSNILNAIHHHHFTDFFKYWRNKDFFRKWKFNTNYTLTDHNLLRIGTVTTIGSNGGYVFSNRLKLATLQSMMVNGYSDSVFLAYSVPWLSCVWYDHPKSRSVRLGCLYMVRYHPDQDEGLFWPKHH